MMNFIPAMSELSRINPYLPIGIAAFGIGGVVASTVGVTTHKTALTIFGAYATAGATLVALGAMKNVAAFRGLVQKQADANLVGALFLNAFCFTAPLIALPLAMISFARTQ